MNTIRPLGHDVTAKEDIPSPLITSKSPIERAVETACDIAANGLPIGKDARLVADITDLNHGDGRPKPAAVIGINFSF